MALKVKKLESTPKKSSVTDNLYNTNSENLLINDDIKTAKEKLMLDYDRIPFK